MAQENYDFGQRELTRYRTASASDRRRMVEAAIDRIGPVEMWRRLTAMCAAVEREEAEADQEVEAMYCDMGCGDA